MRLKVVTAAIALIGALALPTVQAGCPDEPGEEADRRSTTTAIIRFRSVATRRADAHPRHHPEGSRSLDPGTETFPGERVGNTGYVQTPTQTAGSVINNTSAGLSNTQSALPGPLHFAEQK